MDDLPARRCGCKPTGSVADLRLERHRDLSMDLTALVLSLHTLAAHAYFSYLHVTNNNKKTHGAVQTSLHVTNHTVQYQRLSRARRLRGVAHKIPHATSLDQGGAAGAEVDSRAATRLIRLTAYAARWLARAARNHPRSLPPTRRVAGAGSEKGRKLAWHGPRAATPPPPRRGIACGRVPYVDPTPTYPVQMAASTRLPSTMARTSGWRDGTPLWRTQVAAATSARPSPVSQQPHKVRQL